MDKYKDNDLTAIIAAILYTRGTAHDTLDTAIINARWIINEVRK